MTLYEKCHSCFPRSLRLNLSGSDREKNGMELVTLNKCLPAQNQTTKKEGGHIIRLLVFALVPILSILCVYSTEAQAITVDKSHNFVIRQNVKDWGQKTSVVHWRLLTQGRRYDRVTDSSTIFNTTVSGVIQYKFYDELRFYGAFDAVFQTGNAQSRFGDLSPRTGLFVSDSYFLISPFAKSSGDFFTLEVGALNQSRTIGNKVLISGNSFPGVSEVLRFDLGDLGLTLRAQQMVPFSQVENAELAEREATPYFLTESARISWDTKAFRATATAGLFQYSELPSAVAFQSQILGNSVIGDQINAEFRYDFSGWFANFGLSSYLTSKIFMQFKGFLVENQDAPQTLNRGQEFLGSLQYIGKRVWFGPYFGVFSLEPDVSPAFYNASFFGNNNRDGWYAGLDVFVRRPSKMRIRIEYVDSNLLNPGALQEDQESIVVTLQTHFKKLGAW